MVLITDDRDGGGVRVKQLQLQQHQQQKVGGSVSQVHPTIEEEPPSNSEDDYPSEDEDYDEEEDEFEEVDFEDLDDGRSIASDSSFCPLHQQRGHCPDHDPTWSEGGAGQGDGQEQQAMPPPDTMFCAQQISIPPELPNLLKNFTKAAIRTQPKDLLLWSSTYFHALCKGESLPLKDHLEIVATQKTDTGLTPGLLKTLHKQLSQKTTCSKEELQKKWEGLCLPSDQMETLLSLGSFSSEIDWMEFFALGCSALGGTLRSSLKFACEILTEDEEDGAAMIPFDTFVKIYTYLARLDGDVPQDGIDDFFSSLQPQVELQHGMIKPLDFIHQDNMD